MAVRVALALLLVVGSYAFPVEVKPQEGVEVAKAETAPALPVVEVKQPELAKEEIKAPVAVPAIVEEVKPPIVVEPAKEEVKQPVVVPALEETKKPEVLPVLEEVKQPAVVPIVEISPPIQPELEKLPELPKKPAGFQGFDADGNGYLDAQEWERLLAAEEIKRDFAAADLNGDGQLTLEEYEKAPWNAVVNKPQEDVNEVYVPVSQPVGVEVLAPLGRNEPDVIAELPPAPVLPAAAQPDAVVAQEPVAPAVEEPVLPLELKEPIVSAAVQEAILSEVQESVPVAKPSDIAESPVAAAFPEATVVGSVEEAQPAVLAVEEKSAEPLLPQVQEPLAPVILQEPSAPVILEPLAPVILEPLAPVILEPLAPVILQEPLAPVILQEPVAPLDPEVQPSKEADPAVVIVEQVKVQALPVPLPESGVKVEEPVKSLEEISKPKDDVPPPPQPEESKQPESSVDGDVKDSEESKESGEENPSNVIRL